MENEIDEITTLDYAEIYRQNYLDAKDEIRNLKFEIADLEVQIEELTISNQFLSHQLENAEKFILDRKGKI